MVIGFLNKELELTMPSRNGAIKAEEFPAAPNGTLSKHPTGSYL